MATELNKNIKYPNKNSVIPVRKKLKDTNSINQITIIFNNFINAIKTKHLS